MVARSNRAASLRGARRPAWTRKAMRSRDVSAIDFLEQLEDEGSKSWLPHRGNTGSLRRSSVGSSFV
jgi:hypothetical protein